MIVLDTHVLLWWLSEPKKLSKPAARALKNAKAVGVPAINTWEVAMLVAKGRIELDRPALEWLHAALQEPRIELIPLTPAIAVQSTRLGAGFHGDPADAMIVATAMVAGAPLLSRDERILGFGGVEAIW